MSASVCILQCGILAIEFGNHGNMSNATKHIMVHTGRHHETPLLNQVIELEARTDRNVAFFKFLIPRLIKVVETDLI